MGGLSVHSGYSCNCKIYIGKIMNDDRGRFGGDMDRNEVEIDLNKFMELLQEKSTLKDRIR